MLSVQIKDVPPETHAVLRRRAWAAHQSPQEYLRARLVEEAGRRPSRKSCTGPEGGRRAGGRADGSASFAAVTHALREDRDRR